jgi:hypothetical protein
MISVAPIFAASWIAVRPFLVVALASAPAPSRILVRGIMGGTKEYDVTSRAKDVTEVVFRPLSCHSQSLE